MSSERTSGANKPNEPSKASEAKPTPPQLVEQIDRYLEDLAGTLEQGPSERFLAMVRALSYLHRYSWSNGMLILMQRPEATRVAGFQQWKHLGYPVRRGEKGMMILVPVSVKTTEVPDARNSPRARNAGLAIPGSEETSQADPGATPGATTSADVPRWVTRFKVGYVFDVSQLDPDALAKRPLPTFFYPLGDDAYTTALGVRLIAALEAAGIAVEARPRHLLDGAEACSFGGRIAYCDDLDSHRRLLALIHEAGHEFLHHDGVERPKGVRELEAESTSYAVSACLGVDHPFAADYLHMYHNNAAALRLLVNRVRDATVWMLGLLDLDSAAVVPTDRTAPNDSVGERVLCPPPFAVVPEDDSRVTSC